MQSLQFKSKVDFLVHSELGRSWMVEITWGNTAVISTCCSPSAPSPAEPAAPSPSDKDYLSLKCSGSLLLSFHNLDVAYTLRKVFEERLAGLGKVHICSASLLVFKTSQPCTTQEAQGNSEPWREGSGEERGGGGDEEREGWGLGGKLCVPPPQPLHNTKLESNASRRMSDTEEFPGRWLQFLFLTLFPFLPVWHFSPLENVAPVGHGRRCQGQKSAFWLLGSFQELRPTQLLSLAFLLSTFCHSICFLESTKWSKNYGSHDVWRNPSHTGIFHWIKLLTNPN